MLDADTDRAGLDLRLIRAFSGRPNQVQTDAFNRQNQTARISGSAP